MSVMPIVRSRTYNSISTMSICPCMIFFNGRGADARIMIIVTCRRAPTTHLLEQVGLLSQRSKSNQTFFKTTVLEKNREYLSTQGPHGDEADSTDGNAVLIGNHDMPTES